MTLNMLINGIFILWSFSEVGILVFTRTRKSTGEVRDRGSLRVLWLTIVLSITFGTWNSAVERHALFHFPGRGFLVLGVMLLGLGIRWSAIYTLGKSFSANVAIHSTQTLNRSGLFRFMRHPSYTGLELLFLALGIGTGNWIGLAIVVIPTTAALLYRIHVEEIALREAFGAEYVTYMEETKALLPLVY